MDKTVVSIMGILGIGFIAWFFFGKKDEEVAVGSSIDIKVSGGYEPSTIVVSKGKKTVLNLTRADASSCLEEIVIPDFKIRKHLPLNEKVTVEIKPEKPGDYDYSCGMNMFHGKIIVK